MTSVSYRPEVIKIRVSVSVHCQYKHHQTGADIVSTITSYIASIRFDESRDLIGQFGVQILPYCPLLPSRGITTFSMPYKTKQNKTKQNRTKQNSENTRLF